MAINYLLIGVLPYLLTGLLPTETVAYLVCDDSIGHGVLAIEVDDGSLVPTKNFIRDGFGQ